MYIVFVIPVSYTHLDVYKRQALQELANYHRHKMGTRIIGITGTNGKTTTKELIASVGSRQTVE